jgi:hypothetical protein
MHVWCVRRLYHLRNTSFYYNSEEGHGLSSERERELDNLQMLDLKLHRQKVSLLSKRCMYNLNPHPLLLRVWGVSWTMLNNFQTNLKPGRVPENIVDFLVAFLSVLQP